ncbi:DUF3530 family protein [Marinomonas sp. THO17]|uniref:DUF3530 family protein n=1 Tax=Marinomonas sp. THO17 TaxID=3149048 RepID=UPI00336C16E5
MKKILLLTNLVLLCALASLTRAESSSGDTPATEYVTPQPQAERIAALEDSLKERQLEHQIQSLEASGGSFLALYQDAMTSSTQGCVILLHSDNEHPDWPDAIAPLRDKLPEYSWCTIAIEVPDIVKRGQTTPKTLTTDSETTETITLANQDIVFARIQAAMTLAQNNGVDYFALAGYRTGASYALVFLAQNPTLANALALIDIQAPPNISAYQIAQFISSVPQAILDYYLSRPNRNNLFANWRKQAAAKRQTVNGEFIQKDAIPDRARGQDSQALLVQRVRGFLKQNTKQITQRRPLPQVNKGLF